MRLELLRGRRRGLRCAQDRYALQALQRQQPRLRLVFRWPDALMIPNGHCTGIPNADQRKQAGHIGRQCGQVGVEEKVKVSEATVDSITTTIAHNTKSPPLLLPLSPSLTNSALQREETLADTATDSTLHVLEDRWWILQAVPNEKHNTVHACNGQ